MRVKLRTKMTRFAGVALTLGLAVSNDSFAVQPVPGYVAPVTVAMTPDYADDTRGVYVPSHPQHRMRTEQELVNNGTPGWENQPLFAQATPRNDVYERELNRISSGYIGYESELNRIASDPGVLNGPPNTMPQQGGEMGYGVSGMGMPQGQPVGYPAPSGIAPNHGAYPQQNMQTYGQPIAAPGDGVQIAVGELQRRQVDMTNSLVKLREDSITVRRALQRMMDQIGGGEWTIVWDLAESNAGLPEMEVSLYAEEPFMNVLNALLARIQTRSGQPLRVIRYDNTQRLVITDRAGGHRLAGKTSAVGVGEEEQVAITENVLKEAMVSLHYDEIPLVDALENIVNQAGKGEWRLRVYAGLDQVLKPAHVEEPFNIAMERLLKLFNLKYEVFPGGKLIVVTHNNRFGFRGVQ